MCHNIVFDQKFVGLLDHKVGGSFRWLNILVLVHLGVDAGVCVSAHGAVDF